MRLATDGITEMEALKCLLSSKRDIHYEFTLSDIQGNMIGEIDVKSAVITYDSRRDVMRSLNCELSKNDYVSYKNVDLRITPWMCTTYNGMDVRWQLGRFIIDPSSAYEYGVETVKIRGYDVTKIVLDDKIEERASIHAGDIYTSFISEVLNSVYNNVAIEESLKTQDADKEWNAGTDKLTIVNDMLTAINYERCHAEENGAIVANAYVQDIDRDIEMRYVSDDRSVILDFVEVETSKFETPNKFVRYTESADSDYLVSVHTNNSANSEFSTISRGRIIVDAASVNDINSQADLDAYVRRIATEKTEAAETLTFRTLNMPGHGYRNCLFVDIPLYNISGKYIETAWDMDLVTGTMTHTCVKVVDV